MSTIHIKKSHDGMFTAYKKRTGKTTEEALHSSNAHVRAMANFARNAAKGHHALGGPLEGLSPFIPNGSGIYAEGGQLNPNSSHGGDWTNGLTEFNVGGTHEQNPNQGIPQGEGSNGQENRVEQGETKWNNYIFSNRIPVPEEIYNLLGLKGLGDKTLSFSEASKKLEKESLERPNDPISKRGLQNSMAKLKSTQDIIKAQQEATQNKNKFDEGGPLKPYYTAATDAISRNPILQAKQSYDITKDLARFNSPQAMARRAPILAKAKAAVQAAGGNPNYVTINQNGELSYPSSESIEKLAQANYAGKPIPGTGDNVYNYPGKAGALTRAFDEFSINHPILGGIASTVGSLLDQDNGGMSLASAGFVGKIGKTGKVLKTAENIASHARPVEKTIEAVNIVKEAAKASRAASVAKEIPAVVAPTSRAKKIIKGTIGTVGALGAIGLGADLINGPKDNVKSSTPYYMKGTDFTAPAPMVDSTQIVASPDTATIPSVDPNFSKAYGGNLYPSGGYANVPWDDKGKVDWLRYAPVAGSGLAVLSDMLGKTNKPDYSYGNAVMNSVKGMGRVGAPHLGNYMSYQPIDKQYYINMLNAQNSATIDALSGNSGGNRAALNAGLLGNQGNYGNQLGELGMRAKQYNDTLRQSIGAYNRGTDQYNADQDYRVSLANADLGKQALAATEAGSQLNMQQDLYASQGKSANLSNLLNSLGDIGKESQQKGWLLNLAKHGVFGSGKEYSHGGQLNKKKRLTY